MAQIENKKQQKKHPLYTAVCPSCGSVFGRIDKSNEQDLGMRIAQRQKCKWRGRLSG